MQVDMHELIGRCVIEGAEYGVNRAHKHTDNPARETIIDEVYKGIMDALSEVIIWEDRYAECPLGGELALVPQDYRYDPVPHDQEELKRKVEGGSD